MTSEFSNILYWGTPLSKFFIDKAAMEVRENPSHIQAHILSMKRWLSSVPHLKCPNDDRICLAFLRHGKYSHCEVQARLDNFITLRTSPESNVRNWFSYPNIDHPLIIEYLKMGIHVPAGFLQDGSYLLIIRLCCWNNKVLPVDYLLLCAMMQLDRIIEDPRVQVAGLRVFIDLTGISSSLLETINPKKNVKEFSRILQEAYPIRLKGIIYYNEPVVMDVLFKIMSVWLKPKVKERILRVKDNIKKAYDHIPGLRNVMPKEYGGYNKSVTEIIKEQNNHFLDYFSDPNRTIWKNMQVDESKRPESAKKLMREYIEVDTNKMGTVGTYVKLPDND